MDLQFYETPRKVALSLLDKIEIFPGEEVLEPHAGYGAIARVVRECYPTNPIKCLEIDPLKAAILKLQGFHGKIVDFLKYWTPADVIIANPPFMNNFQDSDHFRHAWDILKPGGRMAFVLQEYSAFPKWGKGKPALFTQFLSDIGGRREMLPSFSFRESGTPTGTAIVWVEKEKNLIPIDQCIIAKSTVQ